MKAAALRRLELASITPERTLLEIARVAFADVAGFFNDDGSVKKPHELTEDQRACLASFEVLIKNTEAGDNKQDTIHRFRTWDKLKALEILARHFRLLETKDAQAGTITIQWKQPEPKAIEAKVIEIPASKVNGDAEG